MTSDQSAEPINQSNSDSDPESSHPVHLCPLDRISLSMSGKTGDQTSILSKPVLRRIDPRQWIGETRSIDSLLDGDIEDYRRELSQGQAAEYIEAGFDRYAEMTDRNEAWAIDREAGVSLYALIRDRQPETLVETGVCNGVSTLYQLAALERNGKGHLHSIDFPFRSERSLEEFRAETYEEFGGARIPADKDPGWIVPEELRDKWDLTEGKSQRELPQLLTQLDGLDWFIHDSEHSMSCMLMELELAWEWMSSDGLLLVDDITWNDAFDTFAEERDADSGKITEGVGYLRRR